MNYFKYIKLVLLLMQIKQMLWFTFIKPVVAADINCPETDGVNCPHSDEILNHKEEQYPPRTDKLAGSRGSFI